MPIMIQQDWPADPCADARALLRQCGPWEDAARGERAAWVAYLRQALALAQRLGCPSVAIPVDDVAAPGWPKGLALRLASDVARDFLRSRSPDNELMLYLVTGDKPSLPRGLRSYLRRHMPPPPRKALMEPVLRKALMPPPPRMRPTKAAPRSEEPFCFAPCRTPDTLDDALSMLDESFSQMLLRKLGEKGMKNADCYHRANIDKRLFSKIVNNVNYRPAKTTALALAVALELPLEETRELLMKAGLSLSHSHKLDVIVEFFIRRGQYDLFAINEALYAYDQPLLGDTLR